MPLSRWLTLNLLLLIISIALTASLLQIAYPMQTLISLAIVGIVSIATYLTMPWLTKARLSPVQYLYCCTRNSLYVLWYSLLSTMVLQFVMSLSVYQIYALGFLGGLFGIAIINILHFREQRSKPPVP